MINLSLNRQKQIQSLLLSGYSPQDLTDSRIFPIPFSEEEVWQSIFKLNLMKGGQNGTKNT